MKKTRGSKDPKKGSWEERPTSRALQSLAISPPEEAGDEADLPP